MIYILYDVVKEETGKRVHARVFGNVHRDRDSYLTATNVLLGHIGGQERKVHC